MILLSEIAELGSLADMIGYRGLGPSQSLQLVYYSAVSRSSKCIILLSSL